MTDYKMTPQQYRQRWELPPRIRLVAPNYAKTRSALAEKIGRGRKSEGAAKNAARVSRKRAKA